MGMMIQAFEFSTANIVDIAAPQIEITTLDEVSNAQRLANLQLRNRAVGILIDFPKFSDGRGFTHARRLRAMLPENARLIAGGHIIPDQADYLYRCGFSHALITAGSLAQWRVSLCAVTTRFQHVTASPRSR